MTMTEPNNPAALWSWDGVTCFGVFERYADAVATCAVHSRRTSFVISHCAGVSFGSVVPAAICAWQIDLVPARKPSFKVYGDSDLIARFANKQVQDIFFLCVYGIDSVNAELVLGRSPLSRVAGE